MDIRKKVTNKLEYIASQRYINKKKEELQNRLVQVKSKRIYFFCTPMHSNLGDQAQLLCWLRLFSEWYPSYEVVCVPTKCRKFETLRTIHKNIGKDDLIFIHSGYLIFDPHPELPFILDIVRAFYDRKVVILPQTVNLMGEWYRHIVSQTFNSHPNLTLICRDEVSLEKAKSLFPKVNSILMPDVVTSLIGNLDFQYNESLRKGVLFCVRHDGEKLYTDEQIKELRNRFKGIRTDICDTTIKATVRVWDENREELIRSMLKKFSEYQVIM